MRTIEANQAFFFRELPFLISLFTNPALVELQPVLVAVLKNNHSFITAFNELNEVRNVFIPPGVSYDELQIIFEIRLEEIDRFYDVLNNLRGFEDALLNNEGYSEPTLNLQKLGDSLTSQLKGLAYAKQELGYLR